MDLPTDQCKTYIDNGGSRTNHILFQEPRMSCSDDDDIRMFREYPDIPRILAADRDRSSCIHEKQRKRLPDNIALPYDNDILPTYFYIFFLKNPHDPLRSTGNETSFPEKELSDILTRETVDILRRTDRLDDSIGIYMTWKR